MTRLVALAFACLVAFGAIRPCHAERVVGFEVSGGWNRYSMAEFNDSLSSFNASVGTRFAHLHKGNQLGGAIRVRFDERWLLRAGVEYLFAETKDAGYAFDLGSLALTLGGTRFFPTSSPVALGLGLAVSWHSIQGQFEGNGIRLDASGDGVGVQVLGEAEVPFGAYGLVNLVGGYRFAVTPIALGGNDAGAKAEYSGPTIRLGVGFDSR